MGLSEKIFGASIVFLLFFMYSEVAGSSTPDCEKAPASRKLSASDISPLKEGIAAESAIRDVLACVDDGLACAFPVNGPGIALVRKNPSVIELSKMASIERVELDRGRVQLHLSFATDYAASIVVEIALDCGVVTSAHVGLVLP